MLTMGVQMKKLINWKLFGILLGASIFSIIAIIPYVLTLQANLLSKLPMPLHTLLFLQILQNVILFSIFIFVGLYLAKRVGLGMPILESWLEGKEAKTYLKSILGISIGLGVLVGVLLIGIDFLFSVFTKPITVVQIILPPPPIWQGFLACFYGGICEEVAMRLFFMTWLVWIFYKIKKTREGKPTNLDVWLAIIISAILSGLGHLPITSVLIPITPLIVVRAIILNAPAGIIFGWLYWKKGLESAMISHFSADIILHVVFPLFI